MIAGVFGEQKDVLLPIGLIVEDWETGNMSQYDWETGGNSNWAVSTQTPFEGSYCIKSGILTTTKVTGCLLNTMFSAMTVFHSGIRFLEAVMIFSLFMSITLNLAHGPGSSLELCSL